MLTTDNPRFLYSLRYKISIVTTILATEKTRFYTRRRQHKILYSAQTIQDYTRHRHHKDNYTRHRQHKISILVTDNTTFYTRHRQHKIIILTTDNIKISILATDNSRFLCLLQTTQDFYTCHGQHKILYSPQATQDSILGSNNTRVYSPQTSQK